MAKKQIRVLQVGLTPTIGGMETCIMGQFRHLDHSKIIYDFVNNTCEAGNIAFTDEILKANGRIYNIQSRRSNPIRHYLQWIKLLYKIAPRYRAIVLNMCSRSYVFPVFVAKFFGIPIRIMHSHSSQLEKKPDIVRKFVCIMNRHLLMWSATDYFACSALAGKWMFGEKSQFKVIANSIDTSVFKYHSERRERTRRALGIHYEFVMGHVGRFACAKNQSFLIDIFDKYHKKNKNSILLLVGGGSDTTGSYINDIKHKVVKYHLDDCVKFLGPRNDVPDLMQAMDCFILPSLFEGLPMVGIEAQTAGLPCWFSDVITKEVAVTNLAHYISLNKSPAEWADEIHSDAQVPRKDMSDEIKKSGYDINESIKFLEKYYMETQ